jgi:hypothetical protein
MAVTVLVAPCPGYGSGSRTCHLSAHFDTTARHAEWLGGETPEVKKLAPQQAG